MRPLDNPSISVPPPAIWYNPCGYASCGNGTERQGPLEPGSGSAKITGSSPKKVRWAALFEHLALGAGTEIGISHIAGGPNKYPAGISAAALVAGFKEGSDAVGGRDTKKQAAFHAVSIVAGAAIAALAWH